MIANTSKESGTQQRLAQHAAATTAQGIERGRQVSAVDRGNGYWTDRDKRTRVVPVVDVAAILFQLVVGFETALSQGNKFGDGEITEGVRSLPGIEQEANVGGRDARCLKETVFLDIIRDQVVVARTPKLVEVT